MVANNKGKRHNKCLLSLLIPIALSGCGSDNNPIADDASITLSGSPVKGPLANATISAYLLDTSQAGFVGELVGSGITDDSAKISGLTISDEVTSPVIIEVTANEDTIDITTGQYPVITTLSTLIANPTSDTTFYPTPLTTIALSLAMENADKAEYGYAGNEDGEISNDELEAAFDVASSQVLSTLGFGIETTSDLNTMAPILDDTTVDEESQTLAIAYRTAIEAVSAIAVNVQAEALASNEDSTLTIDAVLSAMALDLSDGVIDGTTDGESITFFDDVDDVVTVITTDISELTIPGTSMGVADVASVLVEETATTGSDVDTTAISSGDITYTPASTVEVTVTLSDADSDGIADGVDNCPAVANSAQTDTDGDGMGNVCDGDDDGDGVSDAEDAFSLDSSESSDFDLDGVGDNADTDDDNDGTDDSEDAFPFDDTEQLDTDEDGLGNNADEDDDGDDVLDTDDIFPLDPSEWLDNDLDGIGNNSDSDDDNDGVEDTVDNCPLTANADQSDADGDGVGDVCVDAIWDEFTWDGAVWQ